MRETPVGPVVVGVTGAQENTGALRFALEEARRLGVAVQVVHSGHQVVPAPPESALLSYQTLEQVAEEIVDEVAEEAEDLAEGVPVRRLARTGSPVHVLVELSESASLVVLQHRSRSRLGRIFTGSTSLGVATRAHCPTVSVPDDWSPRAVGRVTVGVDEDGGPPHVLETAVEEALMRGARLSVLHAWRLDPTYADLPVLEGDTQAWEQNVRRHLEDRLEPWRAKHPDLALHLDLRHHWPAEALLEAAEASDVLLLGRRSSRSPLHLPHLGSLVRATVGHARCPVMVVPEQRGAER